MAAVKCYRAMSNLKVGPEDIRTNGDLIPEAMNWPNADVYVRAHQIEVVWVDEAEIKAWEKQHKTAAVSSDEVPASSPTAKKRVIKKKPTTIKRTSKEVVNSGIHEEAV